MLEKRLLLIGGNGALPWIADIAFGSLLREAQCLTSRLTEDLTLTHH